MSGIHIQRTPIEWEGNRVVIQCGVCGRVVLKKIAVVSRTEDKGDGETATHSLDRGFGQPRNQLLDIADALGAGDGRSRSRTVPKTQVKSAGAI